jgi:hypothetical protein
LDNLFGGFILNLKSWILLSFLLSCLTTFVGWNVTNGFGTLPEGDCIVPVKKDFNGPAVSIWVTEYPISWGNDASWEVMERLITSGTNDDEPVIELICNTEEAAQWFQKKYERGGITIFNRLQSTFELESIENHALVFSVSRFDDGLNLKTFKNQQRWVITEIDLGSRISGGSIIKNVASSEEEAYDLREALNK